MDKKNKTWLITGCSTGLGRAFAEEILREGYNVIVTSRKQSDIQDIVANYPETALGLSLDVTDTSQINEAIAQAVEKFGTIDVLLNNAGYGYRSAVEEIEEEQVRALFDTNFFGTVNMIKAVLPIMRNQKSGTIMNVSSIAGRLSYAGSGYYSASKFAVEGMSDALRKEVDPLGIDILVIEPGAFRTDFAGRSLEGTPNKIADYEHTAGPRRKENDHSHGTQPGNPQKAARIIIEIEESEKKPFRLLLGTDAIQVISDELQAQIQELEAWKEISLSTDY